MKTISYSLFLFLITLAASQAQEGPPPAQVRTALIEQRAAAATADITGTLYFDRQSRVSPEEAARVTEVTFKEGDRVKKEDVLVRLDTRILEKELALKRARLEQVRIRLKNSKLNLDRQTRLFKSNATTESAYDEQRFNHAELLQENIALEKEVEILTIRISKHVVKAPFDGIVLEKNSDIGEWVGPGSSLCLIGADEGIYVQVPVAEHLIRYIQIGETMEVFSHALNQTLTGTMEGFRPIADPKTKNISLKLKLDYSGPVALNMSVTVPIPVSEKQSLFMMPRDALVQNRGQDMVYIIESGKAVPRPVSLVYARGEMIGVKGEGLNPGIQVITQGNERLRPGQAVMIQAGE